jgi:ribokinase
MSGVVVVGSINMDIVNYVEEFPLPGETIKGKNVSYLPGGKGANQAIAAARSGVNTVMIGAVGDDVFGPALIDSLKAGGVDTRSILKKEGSSGLAFITVNRSAENHIILSEGANARLTSGDLADMSALKNAKAVLLQNEVLWDTNRFAMRLARDLGIPVYFNPAPAVKLDPNDLALIHTMILNKTEAECITGITVDTEDAELRAVQWLSGAGVKEVVITLGERGALYTDHSGAWQRVPAYRVDPVDTTAAGDTFIGAFAASRALGESVQDSLKFAAAAAAISATKQGAQASIPDRETVLAFMRQA